jgi:hypothetical protein
MGIGFYLVFYLNRFEPRFIDFDNNSIKIVYFNDTKYFFKRDDRDYSKNEIRVLKKNDALILSNATNIVAKIRRKALDAEDWETLNSYFKL